MVRCLEPSNWEGREELALKAIPGDRANSMLVTVTGDHLKLCINGNLTEMAQDLKSVLALSALCQPVIQWGEPSWGPSN